MACKNKATWFSYLEFKQDGGNYAPSRRGFVCTKTDHGLDQYSSSSITRIKSCRNYAIWKYISTTYLMCFGFRQKERCSGHISPINLKKVDRLQPNDKCKERSNSVLHLTDTKFVTSRESSGITPYTLKRKRNRGNIFIESQYIIFTLKSFTEWQDAYNAFNFLEKQNLVKSHRLVLFNFFSPFKMFIWRWLTWLDMKILFYFLAIHHMDYAKLCSRRA